MENSDNWAKIEASANEKKFPILDQAETLPRSHASDRKSRYGVYNNNNNNNNNNRVANRLKLLDPRCSCFCCWIAAPEKWGLTGRDRRLCLLAAAVQLGQ